MITINGPLKFAVFCEICGKEISPYISVKNKEGSKIIETPFIPSSAIYLQCQKILMKKMDNCIIDDATNKDIHTLIVNLFYYLSDNKNSKSKKNVNQIALDYLLECMSK